MSETDRAKAERLQEVHDETHEALVESADGRLHDLANKSHPHAIRLMHERLAEMDADRERLRTELVKIGRIADREQSKANQYTKERDAARIEVERLRNDKTDLRAEVTRLNRAANELKPDAD